jgi:divalent metal cation (Fe/Co/Zn/Cd) transporter
VNLEARAAATAVRAGKRLSLFSIVFALLEAALAIPAGLAANSVALLGFGLDSLIEAGSAGAVLWGMSGASQKVIDRERISLQVVGALLLALAAYVAYDSIASLMREDRPHPSIFGIIVLLATIAVMLGLRRSKRAVAAQLHSDALVADSKQTEFCAYLSTVAVVGLVLNAGFGLWWADPAAAMVMVPIIVREGLEAVQGKACAHE